MLESKGEIIFDREFTFDQGEKCHVSLDRMKNSFPRINGEVTNKIS